MPFEPGNKLAKGGRKEKPWRDALNRAIKRQQGDIKAGNVLDHIADICVCQAIAGDRDARREVAERLDGKVPTIIGGDEERPLRDIRTIELVAYAPRQSAKVWIERLIS